jgi:hypothetical protein
MQGRRFFVFRLRSWCHENTKTLTIYNDAKMQIELMAIQIVLRRWLQRPDAPICEINPHSGDKRSRPYTKQEIKQMREFLKRHSWGSYIQIFYNEGPRTVDTTTYHR